MGVHVYYFAPDDVVAGSTHWCPIAGSKALCSLCYSTSHRWERGRDKGGWGRAGGSRSRRRVGDVGRSRWGCSGKRLHFDAGGGGLAGVKLLGKSVIHNPWGSVGGLGRARGRSRRSGSRKMNWGWRRNMNWGGSRKMNWGKRRDWSRSMNGGLNKGCQTKNQMIRTLKILLNIIKHVAVFFKFVVLILCRQ